MAKPVVTAAGPGADPVAAVRAFNRFYTNVIGLLRGGHLGTPYSLTEARVLFELARQESTEVAALRQSLDIDAGYLSRIMTRFDSEQLIARQRSATDGRRQVIRLTDAGQAAFAELDARQTEQTASLLMHLTEQDKRQLLAAMGNVQRILTSVTGVANGNSGSGVTGGSGGNGGTAASGAPGAAPPARPRAWLLRPPRPGDLGWVVHRHGAVYARDYGWDETFEHLVARIVADYAAGRDPQREACWIAEVDGEPAGCVFCVREDDDTAQLRLLLVEPSARGLGIGARLVEECLRFARAAGYRQITLWTQDCLTAARRIYQAAGFELGSEGKHHSFGHDLTEQTWSRPL
jgi:DNA-binding MarR family transcriptional regulator/GNAT superfamily N-acetyltransferase